MLITNISSPSKKPAEAALLTLGFRPFFMGAGIFAIVSISVWMAVYLLHVSLPLTTVSASQWHAHEMIYGYGLAVIAGFLLTAVKNWTGIQTLHGKPLLGLFSIWVLARLLMLCGTEFVQYAALADLLFGLWLMVAVVGPIIKAKQWKQMAVLSKLIIVVAGNSLFYLGALGYMDDGVHLSLYGGLYITISLIMVFGRRVIPFFIERGVTEKVSLRQHQWLDIAILIFFVIFFVNELFVHKQSVTTTAAGVLFLLNSYRLHNWHTPGIWQAPLLWGLYVSSWLINLGFLLLALQASLAIPVILTVHLFTIGGIGLMTLSMMSRVSLGHTGRNIKQPSAWLAYALMALVASVIFRMGLPLLDMTHYFWWLTIAYACWLVAFTLFLSIYLPILLKPNINGG